MLAIRAPFSAIGGAVLIVAVFFALARLVDVPFETYALGSPPFVVERLSPTVLHVTPEPLTLVDPWPQVRPRPPAITMDENVVDFRPIAYARPKMDERVRLRGFDGDVITMIDVRPEYPRRAIAGNIEGWVRVRFTVAANGTVRDAVVVESEPGTVFDDATLKAIAHWRYRPRVVNGEAVERVGLQHLFRFELEN